MGNLGRDVELFSFENGNKKVRFTLATNEYYKNSQGEKMQETQWHSIVAWGKVAEHMANFLRKGSHVKVHGKLTHRSYQDKEGRTRYVSEVVASEFVMLGSKEVEMLETEMG